MASASDVLEIIDPVDPDNLQELEPGTWTAKWAPPILGGSIEALRWIPGIRITRDRYEPDNLPGWAAVDFVIE